MRPTSARTRRTGSWAPHDAQPPLRSAHLLVGGDEDVDAAGVHEGHAAEVRHDAWRRRRAVLRHEGLAEGVLDVVVDLALHGHDTDAVDHCALDKEPVGPVGFLVVGHRLLDCAHACPVRGRFCPTTVAGYTQLAVTNDAPAVCMMPTRVLAGVKGE